MYFQHFLFKEKKIELQVVEMRNMFILFESS